MHDTFRCVVSGSVMKCVNADGEIRCNMTEMGGGGACRDRGMPSRAATCSRSLLNGWTAQPLDQDGGDAAVAHQSVISVTVWSRCCDVTENDVLADDCFARERKYVIGME